MKKIMMIIAATVLSCSFAFAANMANFTNTVNTLGLDQAVAEAMAEGNSIDDIMTQALAIEGMNPQAIILAMLNAGADVGAVATVAAKNGVSAQVIAKATQQFASKGQQDTQAYTPAGPAPRTVVSIPVSGVPGGGGGSAPAERYASPSTL
ncbi:MAG: hypothetical protein KKH22_03700 [Proteobacteria bacterium]|nr:hypothetical protein [Pseudomonadota bacterium]